jgi:hypothetical protein
VLPPEHARRRRRLDGRAHGRGWGALDAEPVISSNGEVIGARGEIFDGKTRRLGTPGNHPLRQLVSWLASVPFVFSLGGSQLKVTDSPEPAAATWMLNGPMAADPDASLAVMVTVEVVPTSFAVGVPLSAPVVLLNVAQVGCPVMEKVTCPVPWLTVG